MNISFAHMLLLLAALFGAVDGGITRSRSARHYEIQGGQSERDVNAAKSAAVKLNEVLSESAHDDREVEIFVSGIFLLDSPVDFSQGNVKASLISDKRNPAVFLPMNPMFAAIRLQQTEGAVIRNITIRNFSRNGIYAKDSPNLLISGVTVENTRSTGWSQGAIHLTGTSRNSVISNNIIKNSDYSGIIVDTDHNSDVSNVKISFNLVKSSCLRVSDCGAIYINDRGRHSKGALISNNKIEGFGGARVDGRAIYLDDWASDVIVERNTIYGPGNYAIHIHGGKRNLIRNNNIYLGEISSVLRYGRATNGTKAQMIGNVLSDNRFEAGTRNPSSQFSSEYRSNEGRIRFENNKICRKGTCSLVR